MIFWFLSVFLNKTTRDSRAAFMHYTEHIVDIELYTCIGSFKFKSENYPAYSDALYKETIAWFIAYSPIGKICEHSYSVVKWGDILREQNK